MSRQLKTLPLLITILVSLAMLVHGPIAQLANYHDFADQTRYWGVPHVGDVLSNLGFALVAIFGLVKLTGQRDHHTLSSAWPGYRLFLLGLLLTALGSTYYHLAPDNARLVWDRLPIALACAGLLAAVRAENVPGSNARRDSALLAMFAVASVAWWVWTEQSGAGDLRPYLLLQALPLVLIPLWQAAWRAPAQDRLAFGFALMLYVLAKVAELQDHNLLALFGSVSGHTLKHLLATAAAGVIVLRLWQRVQAPRSMPCTAEACRHVAAQVR